MERFIFCAVYTGSVSNTPNIHQSHGALFQVTLGLSYAMPTLCIIMRNWRLADLNISIKNEIFETFIPRVVRYSSLLFLRLPYLLFLEL